MPKVRFENEVIECEGGERLRDVLLRAGKTPHNDQARWLNCKGFGTCGTCAVRIAGDVSPKNRREQWRLDFPPHDSRDGLRLACQARVLGDVRVTKFQGFWGEHVDRERQD